MMKKTLPMLFFVLLISTVAYAEDLQPDEKVVNMINKYMEALLIEDFEESAKAVAKFVQKSLLENGEINNKLKIYGFRKNHTNAKMFQVPVKVVKVEKMKGDSFGWGETAQKGIQYRYFIEKKSGKGSAPIIVLVPDDGSDPTITSMGQFK